jgi:SPFH domain / Band 7 family
MFNFRNIVLVLSLIAAVAVVSLAGQLVEHLDAQEVMVIQSVSGTLTVYDTPGYHPQWFGKVTKYPRRASYEFQAPIRFNDGAQAKMHGSIQFEIPPDAPTLIMLHSKYGSASTLQSQLVERVIDKSIYMSGPLMSSKESYAEKRNALITYVEDQITKGTYQTRQHDVKTIDPITGVEKTITAVEIVADDKGLAKRQEDPVLTPFGIKTFNFTISELNYDATVEAQIKGQQQITMDVQTAIATAKKAEQQAITVAKEGEAAAAKAKWEQEVLKAKAVVAAQQELEVAQLDTKKAEQEKAAKILRAEGDAEYKRKIIVADGALEQKLAVYKEVQTAWAQAFAAYKGPALVPSVVMGRSDGAAANANGAQALIDMLSAKTARDLALDLSVPAGSK